MLCASFDPKWCGVRKRGLTQAGMARASGGDIEAFRAKLISERLLAYREVRRVGCVLRLRITNKRMEFAPQLSPSHAGPGRVVLDDIWQGHH